MTERAQQREQRTEDASVDEVAAGRKRDDLLVIGSMNECRGVGMHDGGRCSQRNTSNNEGGIGSVNECRVVVLVMTTAAGLERDSGRQ
jgi:hypothetical protein